MTHIATLFFEPLDVLVFRDHRPFLAGQHFRARSRFPLPSVFFGALRAALFERAGARFDRDHDPFETLAPSDRALLGDAASAGLLELAGPILARRECDSIAPLLPWPRDLDLELHTDEERKSDADVTAHLVVPAQGLADLRWRGGELVRLEKPLPRRIGASTGEKPTKERLLLTTAGAAAYARASATGSASFDLRYGEGCERERCILTKEIRSGIALARADSGADPRSVEESMLFSVETWRLARAHGFAVDLSLAEADVATHGDRLRALLKQINGTPLRLGGKGHLARITCLENPLLAPLDKALSAASIKSGTPAKSWCLTPSLIDPATAQPAPCMVLGESIRLGGVNLRGRRRGPRPLVGALVPGSVLFFDRVDDPSVLDRALHADPHGEEHGHPSSAGYGAHRLLPYHAI